MYDAVNSFGRKPCCRCWMNITGDCHDDNNYSSSSGSSYSGGGGGDAGGVAIVIAVVAVVTVVTEATLISNDFYLYPCHSFYRTNKDLNISGGSGYLFGFRKNFKHFSLEYGTGIMEFKTSYFNSYNNSKETNLLERMPVQINVTHDIFQNKTPKKLKLYVGLTSNYVFDYGFGGILGANYIIVGRLTFDLRYEISGQTNQIQAGLIFKYQKTYYFGKWNNFWRGV